MPAKTNQTNQPLARSVRRLSEPMSTESGRFNNTIVPKRSISLTPPENYGIEMSVTAFKLKGDGDEVHGGELVTACENM